MAVLLPCGQASTGLRGVSRDAELSKGALLHRAGIQPSPAQPSPSWGPEVSCEQLPAVPLFQAALESKAPQVPDIKLKTGLSRSFPTGLVGDFILLRGRALERMYWGQTN